MSFSALNILSPQDHQLVSEAVTAAERRTNAEIVTIVAEKSDQYADVVWLWAGGLTLFIQSILVAFPDIIRWVFHLVAGDWSAEPELGATLMTMFGIGILVFIVSGLVVQWLPIRIFLAPQDMKIGRVHRQAIAFFRVAVEGRTQDQAGVVIYLSLLEHRAEILADAGISSKVAPEVWGDILSDMIAKVKIGKTGQGIAEAVAAIGDLLAIHVPADPENANELPDRLIEI